MLLILANSLTVFAGVGAGVVLANVLTLPPSTEAAEAEAAANGAKTETGASADGMRACHAREPAHPAAAAKAVTNQKTNKLLLIVSLKTLEIRA